MDLLKNFTPDTWYKLFIYAALLALITSLITEIKSININGIRLISLGCFLFGIGEWINHPLHLDERTNGILSYRDRKLCFLGVIFDSIGIIIIITGIVKFL